MAYQIKTLTREQVFSALKNFHENQNRKTLAVSAANVHLFRAYMKHSKHLAMNVYDNGSATIIRKTS